PATVQRAFDGKTGSAQFFVESMMDEGARLDKKIMPPNARAWNDQWEKVQLWDNLIYNVDRNVHNMLITSEWELVLIDHSRSFRTWNNLKDPKAIKRFS